MAHPQLLQAYPETATHAQDELYALTADHISGVAYKAERILQGIKGEAWTEWQYNEIKQALLQCDDDPQRLMVMGWMAYAEGGEAGCARHHKHGPLPLRR